MFKNFNRCDFYILLWALYYLQGVLYPQGIINQLLQFVMILIASIETIKLLSIRLKSPIIKSTLLLVLMYCVYGLWIIAFGDDIIRTRDYVYLQVSLNSLLPIFMFYYYSRKGLLNERKIIIYTIIFLLVTIVSYFKNKYYVMAKFNEEDITNNIGYNFVSLLPLLFFYYKKPLLQYILLGVCGVFILMGMKRGAILIGGLSIVIFLYSNLKGESRKRKTITFILSIGIIIGAVYYVSNMLQTSDYFVKRIEQTAEGNSSGRDRIYGSIWEAFLNEPNSLYFLFGHGANSTISVAGDFAHQDWLETIYNNGILGGVILLVFFMAFGLTIYKQRHRFPPYMFYSFFILLFISFSKTMFSMSIQDILPPQSLLLGYFAYWSTRPKEEIRLMVNGER